MNAASTFTNVKTKNALLPERVADQIIKLIVDRQLPVDSKLPNEFELAEQLNVGRGTIREAVKLLVARNVLVIRRGKGTYIAQNPGEVDDPLGFTFFPDQFRLACDLLETRMHLEPWVASVAAERATDEDIEIVSAKCRLVEEDILSGRNHLPNDKDFHVSIANCTHNMVVPKLIPIITYSVSLFGSLNGNSLLSETIVGHRAVLDAIRNHDPAAAQKSMEVHLEQNWAELEAIKEKKETSI